MCVPIKKTAFDDLVEEQLRKQEEERIDEIGLYDAEDLLGYLKDINEEMTEDPEDNQYNRKEPFT